MADGAAPPVRSFAQAAATEEAFVPLRVVQVDGLVLLKIVKHCKECQPALVTGQLLGLDIGSILEVTNCFPFPSRGGDDDDEGEADGANYQLEMMRCLREVNVDNNTVGWYQSTYMGSFQTVELIETFLNYQENIKRCVCIIYDPLRSAQGILALKALRLTDSFMELYRNQNFTGEKLREKNMSWTGIFEEIPVRPKTWRHLRLVLLPNLQKRVGFLPDSSLPSIHCCGNTYTVCTQVKISNSSLVSSVMTDLETDAPATQSDFDRLLLSTNPFYEKNLEFLIECMDDLGMEQQKFQYYYRSLSRQQGQQQAWLQKRRAENMARKAAGEEPLPEEDPNNPVFKPIPEPSRLDSYLITNQVANYCDQINGFSGQSLSKLYLMDSLHEG